MADQIPALPVSSEEVLSRPCALCAKPAQMLCSRCMKVSFCDASCQRGAWRDHKPLCVPAAPVAMLATAMVAFLKPAKALPPAEIPKDSMSIVRVVALMEAHPLNSRVAEAGSKMMWGYVRTNERAAEALSAGALTLLIAQLRNLEGNASVCSATISAIGSIAFFPVGAACKSMVVLDPIVAVLQTHARDPDVCLRACGTIVTLASSGLSVLTAALKIKAIPLLIATLSHSRSKNVSYYACLAISNIALNHAGEAVAVSSGAHPLFVAVLRSNIQDEDKCAEMCNAITNITSSPEGRVASLASGALPQLLAALCLHPFGANVCARAITAVSAIVGDDDAGRKAALAFNTVKVLVSVHARHETDCGAERTLRQLGFSRTGSPLGPS